MLDIGKILEQLEYDLVVSAPNDRSAEFRLRAVAEWATIKRMGLGAVPTFN